MAGAGPGCQNVLVVEDDADIRECIEELLAGAGYRVRTATNGREGLDALGEGFRPDIVLLDLMMPVMNGHEFLQSVRGKPEYSDLPVVVVTAAGQHVTAPGATALVRKPFDVDVLLDEVQRRCRPSA